MKHRSSYLCIAVSLSALLVPGRSMAEIVFQNNDPAAAGIDHNFGQHEGGDQITLAGSCRAISQLELAIIAAPGPVDIIVRIYANDGPIAVYAPAGNEPGTLLFDSGTMTIQATAQFGFNTFTVDVPNVTVPDTITWTVERTDGSGLWLRRYGPPSIGTGHDFMWDRWPTYWAPQSFPNNASVPYNHFYAVVHAAGGSATITCPADVTVACGGDTSTAALGSAVAQGCGPVSVTYTDTTAPGCAGDHITRTWVADDGSATPPSCNQIIQIADTDPPNLTGVPANVTVECDAIPAAATPGATDACSGSATVTLDETATGTCVDATITRNWTATDACGNTAGATQVITVIDSTAPVAACPADALEIECPADTSVIALGSATGNDNCGTVSTSSSDAAVAGCGFTESITRTWTLTDECGNTTTCDQFITTVDSSPPTMTLDTTPITAVDVDCSGDESVTLPTATAHDDCDGTVAVTNDAPASLAAGQTTEVTYTATDACGNATSDSLQASVSYGATIEARVHEMRFGFGWRPHVQKLPLAGETVLIYDRSAAEHCSHHHASWHGWHWWRHVHADCDESPPVASGVTDANGVASIDVPPGSYIVIVLVDTDNDGVTDHVLGRRARNIDCGETKIRRLRLLQTPRGKRMAAKCRRWTGSDLLVAEPDLMVWDEIEQEYPFGLESVGDWGVAVTVEPPEGFIADTDSLATEVNSEIEALQFTVTEVGSDLVPTKTTLEISHKGATQRIDSKVGILLTPDYARSRGFDVAKLKTKGLIIENAPAKAGRSDVHSRQ